NSIIGFASQSAHCPLAYRVGYLTLHLLGRSLADHTSLVHLRIQWISNFNGLQCLDQLLCKFLFHTAVDEKALAGAAGLAAVSHPSEYRLRDSQIHISVFIDNKGVISAQ